MPEKGAHADAGPVQVDVVLDPLLSRLSLHPSLAQIQSYFTGAGFQGDYAGRGPAGVTAILDNQFANLAATVESGISFSGQYDLPTRTGNFKFSLSGTHLFSDRIRAETYEPWVNVANTIAEPSRWKLRAGTGWTGAGFTSAITVNYVNAYENTLFAPSQTIASWTTADLYLGYDTGAAAFRSVRNLKISLSVQNLMDQRPPHVQIPAADLAPGQQPIPFDGTNASPVGRLIALQITKGW